MKGVHDEFNCYWFVKLSLKVVVCVCLEGGVGEGGDGGGVGRD